jgi:hypothetical protein
MMEQRRELLRAALAGARVVAEPDGDTGRVTRIDP